MKSTRALLLCAGTGTRLSPLSDFLPKCLMPIQGRTLLEFWLETLCEFRIEKILINVHHHAGLVNDYVKKSKYSKLVTLVYEKDLLGTGGTLLKNKDFFGGCSNIFLAHADNLSIFNPNEFLAAHAQRPLSTDLTMMTFKTPQPETCGIVKLDTAGVITEFYEKVSNPPGNLANAAVYLLAPQIIAFLNSLHEERIDFSTQLLPRYLKKMYTYQNTIYHRDIGTVKSFLDAQFDFPMTRYNGVLSEMR